MTKKGRLDKLYPGLTARERALLVLQAWKEGTDEDPQVRKTMPSSQVDEYNRYIALMNGCNQHLAPYILLLSALVEQLSLKLGWLMTIRLWTLSSEDIAFAAFRAAREPITMSPYRRLVDKEREREVPVREVAEMLTERSIPDDATERDWKQAVAKQAKDIEKAVQSGTVAAHRRGRRLLINTGSFYNWLGETVRVYPDWGLEYEVLPNGGDFETHRDRFDGLKDAVRNSPAGAELPFEAEREPERMERFARDVSEALSEAIRDGLVGIWRELLAVETVVAETTEEFGGEDPLIPEARSFLVGVRAQLEDLRSSFGEEIELEEPDEEAIDLVRKLVHRELERNSLTF